MEVMAAAEHYRLDCEIFFGRREFPGMHRTLAVKRKGQR